jgi:hypothetical protein
MKHIKKLLPFLTFLTVFIVLLLTARGTMGVPTKESIGSPIWKILAPFDLSPERSRFALTYTIAEDKSFYFDRNIARFTLPDLGFKDGHYVSLFAPGVSFIILPGYILGKFLGASQLGSYEVISLFAILNTILIYEISLKLGARKEAALIASLVFILATPAFAYAVNLYQHHITVFLLLSSIYLLITDWSWNLLWIFMIYAFSITVDYPNAILLLPVLIASFFKNIKLKVTKETIKLTLSYFKFIAIIGIVPPLIFLALFNKSSYGNPLQLAGTVSDVAEVKIDGTPVLDKDLIKPEDNGQQKSYDTQRSALGFFRTRNLINGLYEETISPDRGIIYFAPLLLLIGILFTQRYSKSIKLFSTLVAIIFINITLYALWGDPWGGWAFGSRYLIPTYAVSAILISLVLTRFPRNKLIFSIFILGFLYSVFVNTLGALTSIANPPKVEAEALSEVSGKVEKYTFMRNYDWLQNGDTKSFVYNKFAKGYISLKSYFAIILILILAISSGSILSLYFNKDTENKN